MQKLLHAISIALNISHGKNRFWELDFFRGIAIALMVYYHFSWDLSFYKVIEADFLQGFWQIFGRSIAVLFMLVLGLGLAILEGRERSSKRSVAKAVFKRGGIIFAWGLVITLTTFIQFGNRGFVIFGILHFLGFSSICGYFCARLNRWIVLALGFAASFLGYYFYYNVLSELPWFLPLGIRQYGRLMFDYYAIFPWFGAVLGGIFLGKTLYPGGKRAALKKNYKKHLLFFFAALAAIGFAIGADLMSQAMLYTDPLFPLTKLTNLLAEKKLTSLAASYTIAALLATVTTLCYSQKNSSATKENSKISEVAPIRFFSWMGRYSLPIYLAHQPIFMAALALLIPLIR